MVSIGPFRSVLSMFVLCHYQWTHLHSDNKSTLSLSSQTHTHMLWCGCCGVFVFVCMSYCFSHTHTVSYTLQTTVVCVDMLMWTHIFSLLELCPWLKDLVHKCFTLIAFSFWLCACFCVSARPDSGCKCKCGNVIHCFDYVIAECTAPSGKRMGDKSSKTFTHSF